MVFAQIGLGELLWSIVTVFFMLIYLMVLFSVVVDLFRDHEQSGLAKALWVVFFLVFPLLSVLVYLIARGDGMARRAAAHRAAEVSAQHRVPEPAGATPVDQIARARALRDDGVIDEGEFEDLKRQALAEAA